MSEQQITLLPFGNEVLALTTEEFQAALIRGRELVPARQASASGADDRIVTAEEAEALTKVPATWFEDAMRKGTIPCLRFGKYPRLRLSTVLEAVESRPRDTATQADTKNYPSQVVVRKKEKNTCATR